MRLWSRLGSLVRKLRRRRVLRAAAVYAVTAWIAVQVAAVTFPALRLPRWAHTLVVVLAIFGLPVVVAVAWAFEFTPEGIRRSVEEEESPEIVKPRGTPWVALFLVGVVTTASAGLGWAAWDLWLSPRGEAAAVEATASEGDTSSSLPRTRLAVLPFDGGTPPDSTDPVADGLTLSLIRDLDRIPTLDVVSHRGVRPFRDMGVPVDSVARVLGAGSLVTGSVDATGDSLFVTMQLVDGRTSSSDWTGTLRASRDSLLALRDEILDEAVRGLRRALGEELQREESQAGADSDEAWEQFYTAKRLGERGNELRQEGQRDIAARLYRRADSLFAGAEARDPDWIEPTIERGWLELDRALLPGRMFTDMDDERLRLGIQHASRAVASTGGDPAALELRGALLNALSQLPSHADSAAALRRRAVEDLEKAVARNPDRARAWAELSDLYRREARFDDAQVAARNAREADAFLINEAEYLQKATRVALDVGRLEEALELARRGQRLFPNAEWWGQARLLALSAAGAPMVPPDTVWSVLRRYESLSGGENPFARMQVAAALARQGMADSAVNVLRRAKTEIPDRGRGLARYYEANVRLHLGQRARAFDLLEQYLDIFPDRREYVRHDVYWQPVRDDSAFRALVADRG